MRNPYKNLKFKTISEFEDWFYKDTKKRIPLDVLVRENKLRGNPIADFLEEYLIKITEISRR